MNTIGELFPVQDEKLCFQCYCPAEFRAFLESSFDDCVGWNIQRYQLDRDEHWEIFAEFAQETELRIVSLFRENIKAQWKSYYKAATTGIWGGAADPLPIVERPQEYNEFKYMTMYHWAREQRYLSHLERLVISYEVLYSCDDSFDLVKEYLTTESEL
jgi:hypothetical protein